MYIENLKINIFFSFDDKGVSLDNLLDKSEIYFVGENGVGKTILLQTIAMAVKGKQ